MIGHVRLGTSGRYVTRDYRTYVFGAKHHQETLSLTKMLLASDSTWHLTDDAETCSSGSNRPKGYRHNIVHRWNWNHLC